ncbi:SdpI family protein [Kosakonia sacchari]|uniref:SdpI family protein n=1 Tax=Kosakonia sacchari TaxID=1158459 RepID=UPI0025AFEBEB|nr:SdpI family protein [Kosakonia sacchari]MDN2484225.1 SdpI family protein [Kosakonia sacchari]
MNDIFIYLSIGMLLLMAIAIPLAKQRIKPNRLYGVRTALTLRDEAAWYRVNRAFGVAMIICGTAFFLLSALLGNWRENFYNALINIVFFLVAVSIPAVTALVNGSDKKKRGC